MTIVEPYISASTHLKEITLKSLAVAVVVTILMAASNAYLALKLGMTVSACIPAAVISMAILKFFKDSNILENNLVQTSASAGEVLAMGLGFTLPALLLTGFWSEMNVMTTISVALVGGILGVFMSIPLRRAMILEGRLPFPEGVATAEVLKAGHEKTKGSAISLSLGALVAATIQLLQSAFKILGSGLHLWTKKAGTVVGIGTGFSPAIMGAGYIIGFKGCISIVVGAAFTWFILIPGFGLAGFLPADAPNAHAGAMMMWSAHIRTIGVGCMVFGGLWIVVEMLPSLKAAIASSLSSLKDRKEGVNIPRTELDMPIHYVLIGMLTLALPIFGIVYSAFNSGLVELSPASVITASLIVLVLSYILSALCGSISSYMCGLVGSANNPLSGVTIMAVLITAVTLMFTMGLLGDFNFDEKGALLAVGVTIITAGIASCAAAVAGDNLQDLKSGQIVGSTPWKQQLMLMLGVVVGALTLGLVFKLLFEAYGFGEILPREGMDPNQALGVPKAALIGGFTQAIFLESMNWNLFLSGGAVALVVIVIDQYLKRTSSWRLPTLGVAVGIYMPLDVTMPIFFGGLLAYLVDSHLTRKKKDMAHLTDEAFDELSVSIKRTGMLVSAGLIAGEALMGVALAVPFVLYENTDIFRIVPESFENISNILGFVVMVAMMGWVYKRATKKV